MKPIIKALATVSVCAILATPAQADAQQITLSLSGVVEQEPPGLQPPGKITSVSMKPCSSAITANSGLNVEPTCRRARVTRL